MTFVPRDWRDLPDISTPLTAANIKDLETRVTDYARTAPDGITSSGKITLTTGNSANTAISATITNNTHGVVLNRTAGTPSNGAVLTVTAQDVGTDANPQDTTFGLSGYETGKGTFKVSHNKPVANVTGSDANASAVSIRTNGVGTAAQMIFGDAESAGGTTGKLINLRQEGVEKFVVGPTGDIITGGFNTSDWDGHQAASLVSTMPDYVAQNVLSSITSGNKYGTSALCRKAGTYTKIVICTGSGTITGVTDLKFAVWDSSGTLIAATADVSGTVTATSTLYELTLASSAVLTLGQRVYLGFGVVHAGSFSIRIAATTAALSATRTGRSFQTCRSNASWAGGTMTTLSSGATGSAIWAELV